MEEKIVDMGFDPDKFKVQSYAEQYLEDRKRQELIDLEQSVSDSGDKQDCSLGKIIPKEEYDVIVASYERNCQFLSEKVAKKLFLYQLRDRGYDPENYSIGK
jgi:hypothetical protein